MASHGVSRVAAPGGVQPRSELARQKELDQIREYRELVDLVNLKIAERQYTAEVLSLTSRLLQQNPEYYTIWNYRRLVLLHGLFPPAKDEITSENARTQIILDLITQDLQFLVPLLRKFPKCYWMWNHRLWLLQESTRSLPKPTAIQLWKAELGLAGKMLSLDSRNFMGWGYRRTVVANLEDLVTSTFTTGVDGASTSEKSMVEAEFVYTTKMINTNLSNFSAWHNRGKLIPRLLEERHADNEARQQFLDEEFELILQALYTDPYDQSLWFYHQFLISTISPSDNSPISLNLSPEKRISCFQRELKMIKELQEDAQDCKYIYQALLLYTSTYWQLAGDRTEESKEEAGKWLDELQKLDPLRKGRWNDLRNQLGLTPP